MIELVCVMHMYEDLFQCVDRHMNQQSYILEAALPGPRMHQRIGFTPCDLWHAYGHAYGHAGKAETQQFQ